MMRNSEARKRYEQASDAAAVAAGEAGVEGLKVSYSLLREAMAQIAKGKGDYDELLESYSALYERYLLQVASNPIEGE